VTITGSTTYTANPLNQYTAITGNPAPTYDADGNLLSGLRSPLSAFTCTWNGENRMLSSTSANVAITDRRVENAYDALGRRVRKTVKFASTGAVIEDRYFIYDGWNVIEETIAPATGPVETAEAVWGADLSGTAQGAGGVGGLLLRESSATGASYYHYDGNGNVTALTSGAGTVQAAYTYGPFGETLRAVGPLAQANPWRFSTKYQDDETGLLYYGYRFYNPTDGRWPSRDPVEEEGGVNLYGMVVNNPINIWDLLGLDTYLARRKLGGGPAKPIGSLFAHQFAFVVDPKTGEITTYSWGNTPTSWDRGSNKWFANMPEDIAAAKEALANKLAVRQGGVDLDGCMVLAFTRLADSTRETDSNHWNLGVIRNCKTESCKLIETATSILNSTK
jgi:RHS repeat-associated protein